MKKNVQTFTYFCCMLCCYGLKTVLPHVTSQHGWVPKKTVKKSFEKSNLVSFYFFSQHDFAKDCGHPIDDVFFEHCFYPLHRLIVFWKHNHDSDAHVSESDFGLDCHFVFGGLLANHFHYHFDIFCSDQSYSLGVSGFHQMYVLRSVHCHAFLVFPVLRDQMFWVLTLEIRTIAIGQHFGVSDCHYAMLFHPMI